MLGTIYDNLHKVFKEDLTSTCKGIYASYYLIVKKKWNLSNGSYSIFKIHGIL